MCFMHTKLASRLCFLKLSYSLAAFERFNLRLFEFAINYHLEMFPKSHFETNELNIRIFFRVFIQSLYRLQIRNIINNTR